MTGEEVTTDQDAGEDDGDPVFIVFSTSERNRKYIEDPYPQDINRIIAMGTGKPLFACAYSGGQILIFDMETSSFRLIDSVYSPGNIQALCFSEGDDYLLVLTMDAKLDVYDLSDGSLLMSEVLENIKERNESTTSSYGIFSRLSCRMDKEQNRMHVFASMYEDTDSYWTCINTDAWVITAHASGIYAWIPEDKSLYGWERGPLFLKYPVYSLEDLADWARSES